MKFKVPLNNVSYLLFFSLDNLPIIRPDLINFYIITLHQSGNYLRHKKGQY